MKPIRYMIMFGLIAALSGCILPRSGPSRAELLEGAVENGGDAFIVEVTDQIVALTNIRQRYGFGADFINAGEISLDIIRPGDMLVLTFWENVQDGILTTEGAPASLSDVQVDHEGMIFVPYAGRIRAADHTAESLRRIISEKLNEQTPDPQVMVSVLSGNAASVSIMGGASGQGIFPIQRSTRRLSGMLASAGGVSADPAVTLISVTRGNHTGRIWLQDLFDNSRNNIALRDGDRIIVEEDRRAFTAMGATGSQSRLNFPTPELTALNAIAAFGGLQSSVSDPTGVFVLREEDADIANAILGRNDLHGPQRMIYALNLTEPNGLFLAREFMIRDEDTIYVTEAPFVQWNKAVSALVGSLGTANTLSNNGN